MSTTYGLAKPLPANLPAAPRVEKNVQFPETLKSRDHAEISGSNLGTFSHDGGRGKHYGVFFDDYEETRRVIGGGFEGALSAANKLAKSFGDNEWKNVGVLQARDGSFYISPAWWNSEGNDNGDVMVPMDKGFQVRGYTPQLKALVGPKLWADLRQ